MQFNNAIQPHKVDFNKPNEEPRLNFAIFKEEIRQLERAYELYQVDSEHITPDIHDHIKQQIDRITNKFRNLECLRQVDPQVLAGLNQRFTTFQNNYAKMVSKPHNAQSSAS